GPRQTTGYGARAKRSSPFGKEQSKATGHPEKVHPMIITSVAFEPCVMPLEDKNWKFALGTASTSRGWIVRLTADGGQVGYGYANSSPHMGSTFETLPAELERFKPILLGKDPFAIELILRELDRSLTGASQAKAGIDCA